MAGSLCWHSGELKAQWLEWRDETEERLVLESVANSDDEEKDIWADDFNNDGRSDIVVVRKEPFSNPTEPEKPTLLLMNVNGILTDQTELYAPEFITLPSYGRDVHAADFDGDGWKDIIIANTFDQQPQYYHNLGEDGNGNWLGFENQSAERLPELTADNPLICAVWAGDVTGDGWLDIYFVNYNQGGTAFDFLLINDGTGHFTEEAEARMGDLRHSAFGTAGQIADIDGDGDMDILKVSTLYDVSPWNTNGLFVLFNEGGGYFSNWQNLAPGAAPYMFELADFNLDGQLDVYIVDDGYDYVRTISSVVADESLTYTTQVLNFSSVGGFGGNLDAADLDLDGDMDIVVADVDVDIPPCASGRRMAIFENVNGIFQDPYGNDNYFWVDNAYDVFLLDINGNGLSDIFVGRCEGYSVIMNDNCGLAPNPSDYDQDGLADSCDPCPTNPDPNCTPPTEFPTVSLENSVARQWNELLLASIRRDFARPTVHARNLFHLSSAMWDAWAAFEPGACPYLLGQELNGFVCAFDGMPAPGDVEAARDTAISYASYRLLLHRFAGSPQAALLQQAYEVHLRDSLGFDPDFTSVDYSGGSAAALGNYIAQCYIEYGWQDGSNELLQYSNTFYEPVNAPLVVDEPGNPGISDMNRWQPLTLEIFIDQSGNEIPGSTPPFLSPEWGQVLPFSLQESDKTVYERDGNLYPVYHDPGGPPLHSMDGNGSTDDYRWGFETVITWSAQLDPTDGVMWDISPASLGNRTYPESVAEYPAFYDQLNGGTQGAGHAVNPATGAAYAENLVPRADYARVLAEFWADGPDSETPPGHWFTILNYVSDYPGFEKRYRGEGEVLIDLEWDVKSYFALGGAMHDVAVSVWGMKGWYDFLRPISAIRALADLGQRSDPGDLSYHPGGLSLIPGYIELVYPGDALEGAGGEHVGKIKVKAWRGHTAIDNVDSETAGVDWVLAENWEPYQRPSFVTPPFAGYISGHSTYSAAAAEVLTLLTGDPYFPGGMAEFVAEANAFLVFEDGPSVDVHLQWATYRDAADESALSRIWGGIHPPCDDIPGRFIGVEIGMEAFVYAENYFSDGDGDGECDAYDPLCSGDLDFDGTRSVNDLLIILSQTGCTGDCSGDLDKDGLVGVSDILFVLLPVYGLDCP